MIVTDIIKNNSLSCQHRMIVTYMFLSEQSFLLFTAFIGLDLKSLGIPLEEELIQEYCQRMNIPPIDNWEFYVAFNFFRFAAILQGVYKRAISGNIFL